MTLVLSRQRDESTIIGDDVEVTVVDIRGDKVRLGVRAPERYQVYRKELFEVILRDIRGGKQPPPVRPGRGGLLVLARMRDESLVLIDAAELQKLADAIGRGQHDHEVPLAAVITVVDIRGDKVRVGYDAPRDVSVHRKEVYDAIVREGRQPRPRLCPAC